MSELRNTLCAVVLAALLAPHSAQAAPSNLRLAAAPLPKPQEFAENQSSQPVIDSSAQAQTSAAAKPAVTRTKSATHKVVHHAKHKKTKGKTTHQASAKTHHKKITKKTALRETHHRKKIASAAHAKQAKAPAPKIAEATRPSPITRKKLGAVSKSTASASRNANNVAYTFCLGYDNCVPTRYETTGGMTRIVQKTPDGDWTEARIDPVMASDLDKLAHTESSGTVIRPLTDAEKTRIADHQGKVHAELVGDVQAGPEKKEQAKTLMRELHIRSASDLEAYDPKLRNNPAALDVASELSAEHVPAPGR